jgi:hypothetical protein
MLKCEPAMINKNEHYCSAGYYFTATAGMSEICHLRENKWDGTEQD